jgi:anti-anti-sigma regulatory factor
MRITSRDPTTCLLEVSGKQVYKTHEFPPFRKALDECEATGQNIEIDFSEIGAISGDVLASLVELHRRLEKENRTLVIAGLSVPLQEIFRITNLDKKMTIRDAPQA